MPDVLLGAPFPRPRRAVSCLVFLSLAFLLCCTVPYAVAHGRTPPGTQFTGLLLNSFDQEYYLAAQRSIAEDLPQANRFTSEPNAPGPVSPIYPMLGVVQKITGLSPIATYHLPRLLAVVVLPFLLYYLLLLCLGDNHGRALAGTAIGLFAVGMGTFNPGIFLGQSAADNVPEATILYSFMVMPHFSLAYVGIVLCLTAVVLAWRGPKMLKAAVAGIFGSLLLNVSHTFLFLPLFLALAVLFLIAVLRAVSRQEARARVWRLLLGNASIFLPAIPFLISFREEAEAFRLLQGRSFPATPSASWWTWVAGYIVIVPLFLVGAVTLTRELRHRKEMFGPVLILSLWFLAEAALLYSRFTPFQRRYSEGLIVPLAAMAGVGLCRLIRSPSLRTRAPALLAVTLLVVGAVRVVQRTASTAAYLFDHQLRAFSQLRAEDVVLAGYELSAAIPAYSPATVYVGRTTETVHYPEKVRFRKAFARDPQATELQVRLRRAGITTVIVDDLDPSFSFDRAKLPDACLQLAFEIPPLTAYRLTDEGC